MKLLLFVTAAGGAGSALRYLAALASTRWYGSSMPATLAVNVIGSFLIAIVAASPLSPSARTILTTGLLGGFTTYSAFNEETLQQFRDGREGTAAMYVIATITLCAAAGAAGFYVARRFRAT